ncbi:MAG: iron-containing alcohol dehydrogenase [Candidatus Latescibacteria bacterium]|nr:iron-containing alcohol dehydrogenase [Candidatus Latescibacterota bacterium]
MTVQINEELLDGSDYFADPARRVELGEFFHFDQRRVLLGEGALDTLADECGRLGLKRVLLVRDPGIVPLGELVVSALNQGGVEVVGVFDKVISNPTVASVDQCAQAIKEADCQGVITLGGGSTMDTVKAGRCVATSGGSIRDYFGFDMFKESAAWPALAIPTTAGTGSEAGRVAVIADETGKKAVYSDQLTPEVALVDPQLSRNLPPLLTAITGLDALGHALECTASTKSNALGDAVARESLRSGAPFFTRAVEGGAQDPEARLQMARCSLLAGLLLGPINTGAGHALGYGIEKVSHAAGKPVPHGTAVALVLPGVMRHNAPAAADKYYYTAGVAGMDLGGKSRAEGVELAAGWIDGLRRQYTPYGSLRQAGLSAADIPQMVELAMEVRRLLDPNPVVVTAADAEAIYRGVLE